MHFKIFELFAKKVHAKQVWKLWLGTAWSVTPTIIEINSSFAPQFWCVSSQLLKDA